MKKPRIALTMGDPAGVGPELCLRALANSDIQQSCTPIVFGDVEVLRECADVVGLSFDADVLHDLTEAAVAPRAAVLHLPAIGLNDFRPGHVSADTGSASFRYIESAIDAARAGQVSAVTTASISKEALSLAGIEFPGHTEIFADRCGTENFCMMQYSPEITCTFVTVHVGLADVVPLLTEQRIADVIQLTANAIRRLKRVERPRIAVCGLNPHAGENGLFGDREEERFIRPALARFRSKNIELEGPLPADTAFLPWRREVTDAFVCMYHDQGHIPVKALAFDSAVNTTLGLPVVRTSVDHGTACDIAWQGKAHPDSLFAALRVATELSTEAS